jgi:hypothetical protein
MTVDVAQLCTFPLLCPLQVKMDVYQAFQISLPRGSPRQHNSEQSKLISMENTNPS